MSKKVTHKDYVVIQDRLYEASRFLMEHKRSVKIWEERLRVLKIVEQILLEELRKG